MRTGTIFNIQRYSIHDGPGIRTTVFLKGCPMNCWWCHNPESQRPQLEMILWEDRCIGCGDCIKACPDGLAALEGDIPPGGRAACSLCGRCAEACPAGAREMIGREMTSVQVMAEIEKDLIFYDQSGGGVTFSGGEPLMQPEFLDELLQRCRQKGIHTAVDTSGFSSGGVLSRISGGTDLFLYDMKHMDDERHKRLTGVSNSLILDNLRLLSSGHSNIIVRIPVIPELNDDDRNISDMGAFIRSLGLTDVNILPYHNIGMDKYRRLSASYRLPDTRPPSREKLSHIEGLLKGFGLNVKIGG